MTPIEMRAKRAGLIKEGRAIVEAAKGESRADLTAEEQQRYDSLIKESNELLRSAEREEELERLERGLNDPVNKQQPIRPNPADPAKTEDRTMEQRRDAYRRFLRGNIQALSEEERRDLQADSDAAGGYIVPPQEMVDEIIREVDNQVFIRRLGRTFQVGREGLGVPTVSARAGAATWGTELQVATADSTLAFGKRELKPLDLTFLLKVSRTLLNSSPMADRIVNEEIAYTMAVTEEQGFIDGDGATQPLGLFTASSQGISTSRDVSSGNTTTAIGADNLRRVKYSVKQTYWPRTAWIFHRDAMRDIALLKDGNGQYLLQPGLREEDGERLLNRPVYLSEYAPNTFTTGLYVGLFGDLSQYWIADALGMTVQRLVELYAASNQVGFIARAAVDGMPVKEEAFARVTLA